MDNGADNPNSDAQTHALTDGQTDTHKHWTKMTFRSSLPQAGCIKHSIVLSLVLLSSYSSLKRSVCCMWINGSTIYVISYVRSGTHGVL